MGCSAHSVLGRFRQFLSGPDSRHLGGVLVVGVQTIDKLLISLLLMKVLLIRLWPIEGLLVAGATY